MALPETVSAPGEAASAPYVLLALEFAAIFLAMPLAIYFHATRWSVHVALWVIALYGFILLRRSGRFSWRELWHGDGWPVEQRKIAVLRWVVASAALIILASHIAPEKLFSFPMERPWFWLLVMFLYPLLSVVPQELVLRSFFFWRYRPLFSTTWAMIAVSTFCFGFVHIVLANAVAPILAGIGGVIFAHSYSRHRSLKWATLEHAAYGCMVFTVGLGPYFLVGGLKP